MKNRLLYIVACFMLLCGCSEDTIDGYVTGDLTGKVVKEGSNDPIENVRISTNPTSSTVFTNAEGEFVLENIPEGEYSVEARKDGLLTAFEGATVYPNSNVNVIFEMSVESASNRQPTTPDLIQPEDGQENVGLVTEFMWSSSDPENDELTYQLELRNDHDDQIQIFEEIKDTTFTVDNLSYGYKYFWQVKVSDSINPTVISEINTFYTEEAPANSIFFVRTVEGNNVIFNSDLNGQESRLTELGKNSFRPRKNSSINKVAYLSDVAGETQIFIMNPDGSQKKQVTSSIPVKTIDKDKVGYSWSEDGTYIIYPHLNKLYKTTIEGGGKVIIYDSEPGRYIMDVEESYDGRFILILETDVEGYNGEISILNSLGEKVETVINGFQGVLDGIDLSVNNRLILYSRDISGYENLASRQLNSKIFIYDRESGETYNLSESKPNGTNDMDARFAPNEASVIFVNGENTLDSQKNIIQVNIEEDLSVGNNDRNIVMERAFMPEWN
ncbi:MULTISPECIES: carboxypeptidase regulatory-like domain-containing protein [Christiangramia]|uniref:Uncharacterized protein n=1 Tax=Christiangramia flava JLT2011 TaxID=1229726 RepID=A0A1L7I1W0_9FLAO|nr:carboxypeptidase regulatory-like domain-containing protein [Christiangramia flava]APU67599.1 hypothetical protein GRFL_0875 [Christiangramia flava JLT2011]OSS40184.1 hypothetical protein C723_1301 [Christiangramia flava JLT2011]